MIETSAVQNNICGGTKFGFVNPLCAGSASFVFLSANAELVTKGNDIFLVFVSTREIRRETSITVHLGALNPLQNNLAQFE